MAKTNTIPTPTKPTPSLKALHQGKLNLTNKRGRAKQRTASIKVATGVSEAVSEVHHPKKSRQTNKESNRVIQQNANKKIKCINSDNIKTHRITKNIEAERRYSVTANCCTEVSQCIEREKAAEV